MKTTIATDNLQSQRLLRCGVSADTADMCWYIESGEINIEKLRLDTELMGCSYDDPKRHYEYIPAWSLSALLTKVLPSDIDLRMLKLGTGAFNNPNAWSIMYSADLYTEHSDIFEACVLMVEQLTANGYKLNEQ